MRSYEEIEKNAYKKAEIRLAEIRRRNTVIKRTALSSGICAAAIAGVWFVSGESTRDSFRKKHDENIVTDEEMPSEEYSGQILFTTTTAEISAISTTTAAADAPSTDAPEGTTVTVTTSAADSTSTDVPEENPVTTTENIPEENPVTTSAKTTERTTKKTTSATTARHTTTRTNEALPLITTSKTTARPKTTSKRTTRTTTTEIPDITTPVIDEPVPVITTTRKIPEVMTTTTMSDSGVMNPSPVPDTTTSPEPPAGEYTVVYIETPGEAEQIYKTITNKNGEQYQYVKTGIIAGLIDGSNSSLFLSVYDPEKNVYYQANPAMLVMPDNTIALKFGEHSRYWLFYQLVV